MGAYCIDYCANIVAGGRNPRLWLKQCRPIGLVCHTGGGKPPNRLAKPARGLIGLLLERRSTRVGFKRHLPRYDAVYGDSANRLDAHYWVPTNCFMAT